MKTISILFTLLLISCAQAEKLDETSKTEQNTTIGENLNANRYTNIYFAGQPSDKDLKKLKEQGFTHIINLRSTKEYDEKSESNQAKKLGLNYSLVTMDMNQPLTDEYIESVTKQVMAHRKEGKTLIHCGSGQRVGLWVGGHFFKDHKYSKEKSVEIAKEMGLSNPKLLDKLNTYLKSKPIKK